MSAFVLTALILGAMLLAKSAGKGGPVNPLSRATNDFRSHKLAFYLILSSLIVSAICLMILPNMPEVVAFICLSVFLISLVLTFIAACYYIVRSVY